MLEQSSAAAVLYEPTHAPERARIGTGLQSETAFPTNQHKQIEYGQFATADRAKEASLHVAATWDVIIRRL